MITTSASLRPRVAAFMQDLDEELWKLGILAKTKHNEVAPCQHEMAPIFTTTNIATDHNQLTMEVMQNGRSEARLVPACCTKSRSRASMAPASTTTGRFLPMQARTCSSRARTPSENAQFLLFLTAVIKAVDEYQDLLRISVASAGNDHRLGANEAPPAIISMFIGDELAGHSGRHRVRRGLHATWHKTKMNLGVTALPAIPKDTTDRNRTSPFAFTGNKFEFRMLGSSRQHRLREHHAQHRSRGRAASVRR